tara:strand:- start:1223 stop:1459 length:237 start_codon:yes stop_codon:yes gene_type:complete
MNPFININKNNLTENTNSATYKIMSQVDALEVGESTKINLQGLTVVSARGCLSNRARKMNKKFRTRMPNGELWVLRVL